MTATNGSPPVAPAQGIAVAPVTVTAGVLSAIPLPALPNGGPVPWRTPWVVLLNSSPFTLLVSSGGVVTQIAAFTSDKVFCQAVGLSPTVLSQPGLGTPAVGSDSTVYATWYADEPPGTYPAALGSGAVAIALSTKPLVNNAGSLGSGNNQLFGPFNIAAGFAGLRVAMTSTQTMLLNITYFDGAGNTTAQRSVIIKGNGSANFTIPHQGDSVQFQIFNQTINNATFTFTASQSTLPQAQWAVGLGQWINVAATVNTGATTILGAEPFNTYAGPATWRFLAGTTGAGGWTARLKGRRENDTLEDVYVIGWNDLPGFTQPQRFILPVTIPPMPISVEVTNSTAANANFVSTVNVDSWRCAA